MNAPLISIVIPTFNRTEELRRSVASAWAQDYRPLEVVVVDDGSTDPAAVAAADALAGEVRLVRTANGGPSAARNRGAAAATGDLLFFLDCGDTIAPDALGWLAAALAAAPSAGFAYPAIVLKGERSGTLLSPPNYFEVLFSNRPGPPGILIPARLFAELGGFDETMRTGSEDWEFAIACGRTGAHGTLVEAARLDYWIDPAGHNIATALRHLPANRAYIERKHRAVFRTSQILRLWREWRAKPGRRPAGLYLAVWFMSRLTGPRLYRWLALWLARRRTAA